MGRVTADLSMSLDGFIAGPNDGSERPLGDGGDRLFELSTRRYLYGLLGCITF